MFNIEQRASDADKPGRSLAPVVISLLNTYAGLSLAVAGLVLDTTALVVGGLILVVSASDPSASERMIRASHYVHR
jgi:NAD/NADP transhydrogenase beta subunit